MAQGYRQLAYEDRVLVYRLWKLGVPQASIAGAIRVSRSTIFRELRWLSPLDRNRDSHELARQAQEAAMARKSSGRSAARLIQGPVWQIVRSKLCDEKWTPEQIANWLSCEVPEYSLSYQTIYNHIYDHEPDLIQHLRRKGKPPRRWRKPRRRLKLIEGAPAKTWISERPDYINNRERFGDWEVDTVGATSRSTLLVLLERCSRFTIILKVQDRLSETVRDAIFSALVCLPPELRRTLTYDNGPENARFFELNQQLETSSFFCAPYHSWEKGSVENRIGVVRIFFPKGTNFDLVSDQQVALTQYLVNYRPMKLLGNRFPAHVFQQVLSEISKKAA